MSEERPFRLSTLAAVLPLLVAFLLVSCTGRASDAGLGASGGSGKAPDFSISAYQGASAIGGEEVRFSTILAQGKPVVLNFFAGLCPPCRAEMPDFQRVHEQFQDRVLIFSLDIGPFVALGSHEDGKRLVQQLGLTYPAGSTAEASVVRDYRVAGMPTTVFVTPKGTIVRQHTGLLTRSQMIANIEELLRASAQ